MVRGPKRRKIRFLGIILGSAFVWGIPSVSLPKSPYKVGTIFALTGPASVLGDAQRKTVWMIEQWVNGAGGIDGHPLEVLVHDTGGDEEKAASALRKVVEKNGVVAVIGTSRYGIALSVMPIIGEYKVPFISCAGSIPLARWVKWRSWVFQVAGYRHAVEAIYEHMRKRGIAKIAMLTPNSAFGRGGRTDLIKLAPKYGIEITFDGKYRPEERNMKVLLTKVRGTGGQAVINWSDGVSQVEVCRNLRDLRMKLPLYQGPEFGNKRMVKLAKGKAEGVLCPLQRITLTEKLSMEDPQMPALIAYKYSFVKKFGIEPTPSGGHAWDALWMIVEALRIVGPDKKKIKGYLEKHIRNWPGVTGIFNMSKKDHSGLTKEAFIMGMVRKGAWEVAH